MTATKAFFKLLFDRELCQSFEQLAAGKLVASPGPTSRIEDQSEKAPPQPTSPTVPSVTTSQRSDAISLLSALQREARLLDIVHESLDAYSDEQIGAAAREVLRDTGQVIERMFGTKPLTDSADGTEIETPATFDPAQYHLTGNVSGEAPYRGTVAHHGWQATRCEVPVWTGNEKVALVVSPVEIEVN